MYVHTSPGNKIAHVNPRPNGGIPPCQGSTGPAVLVCFHAWPKTPVRGRMNGLGHLTECDEWAGAREEFCYNFAVTMRMPKSSVKMVCVDPYRRQYQHNFPFP